MLQTRFFTSGLAEASYVATVILHPYTGNRQSGLCGNADFAGRCSRKASSMSSWRWQLFGLIARLELREDIYLRIPTKRTVRHDVSVEMCSASPIVPTAICQKPSRMLGQGTRLLYMEFDAATAPLTPVVHSPRRHAGISWLPKLYGAFTRDIRSLYAAFTRTTLKCFHAR